MFYLIITILGVLSITSNVSHGAESQYTVHRTLATWSEAKLQCHRKGGVLVSPTDGETLNAMKSLVKYNKTYYIGVRATYLTGKYISVEGVPFKNMTEAMDSMVQELDPFDGDCMAMDRHNIRLVPCWTRLQYICKSMNEVPGTIHLNTNKTNCGPREDGYIYKPSSRKCFKVHEEPMSWQEGSVLCTSETGRLAVIENDDDRQNIISIYNFHDWYWIFIGLQDAYGEGDWKTMDGRPVEELYNVWESGRKPTSEYSYQQCGTIDRKGILVALPCYSRPFFCEREPTF